MKNLRKVRISLIYFFMILLIFQIGGTCGPREKRLIIDINFDPEKLEIKTGESVTFRVTRLFTNVSTSPKIKTYYWRVEIGDTGTNLRSATTEKFITTFVQAGTIKIKLTYTIEGIEGERFITKTFEVILKEFFVSIKSPHDKEEFFLGMNPDTGTPLMPSTLTCKGLIWDSSTDFGRLDYIWLIEAEYTPTTGGPPIKPDYPIASATLSYEDFKNEKEWKPNFIQVGGDLKITLKVKIRYQEYEKFDIKTVIIRGVDPPKDKLLAYIGDTSSSIGPLPKLYKAICYEETGWNMKQFSFGRPYISSIGGRIGLMGIKKTYYLFEWGTVEGINKIIIKDGVFGSGQSIEIYNEDIWNWQKNIDKGKEIYGKKLSQAKITHTFYQYKSSPQFPPALTDTDPDYQLTREALSLYYTDENYWVWNGTSWIKNTSNTRGTDYADTVVNFALNPPDPAW